MIQFITMVREFLFTDGSMTVFFRYQPYFSAGLSLRFLGDLQPSHLVEDALQVLPNPQPDSTETA